MYPFYPYVYPYIYIFLLCLKIEATKVGEYAYNYSVRIMFFTGKIA